MDKKILFLILLTAIILTLPGTASAGVFCDALKKFKTVVQQVGGTLVVISWVIAGILYLTAIGNPQKMDTAKKALIAAIIGTVLVLLAGSAIDIVKDAFGNLGNTTSC